MYPSMWPPPLPKDTFYLLRKFSLALLQATSPQGAHNLTFITTHYFTFFRTEIASHSVVSGFFHTTCFWNSLMSQHVQLFSFYCWIVFHCMDEPQFFVHFLLMGNYAVSSSELLWVKLLWTFMTKFLCRHVSIFLAKIPRSRIVWS